MITFPEFLYYYLENGKKKLKELSEHTIHRGNCKLNLNRKNSPKTKRICLSFHSIKTTLNSVSEGEVTEYLLQQESTELIKLGCLEFEIYLNKKKTEEIEVLLIYFYWNSTVSFTKIWLTLDISMIENHKSMIF